MITGIYFYSVLTQCTAGALVTKEGKCHSCGCGQCASAPLGILNMKSNSGTRLSWMCVHTHSPTHHQSSSIKHPWLGQRHPSACHILHNVPTCSWKPEQGDEELNTKETHIPKSWDRVSCAGHDGGYQHNSNLETQHIYFIYLNQGYVIFKKRKSLNLRWSY